MRKEIILEKALAKVAAEDQVRGELAQGHKLAQVFARHKIL